jgi:hypothetical protein
MARAIAIAVTVTVAIDGCLVGAAPVAGAQPVVDPGAPPSPAPTPRIEVRVGETAERDVGIAVGYRCDDPALVRVEMRTKREQANAFVVTGVQAGVTLCRVGTDPLRPSFVYEIRVLPRRER